MNDNFEKTLRKINKNLTDKVDNFPYDSLIEMVPNTINVEIKFNIENGDLTNFKWLLK
jgi:hypothetical protein